MSWNSGIKKWPLATGRNPRNRRRDLRNLKENLENLRGNPRNPKRNIGNPRNLLGKSSNSLGIFPPTVDNVPLLKFPFYDKNYLHFRSEKDKPDVPSNSGYWRNGIDVSDWYIPDDPEKELKKIKSKIKTPSWYIINI